MGQKSKLADLLLFQVQPEKLLDPFWADNADFDFPIFNHVVPVRDRRGGK